LKEKNAAVIYSLLLEYGKRKKGQITKEKRETEDEFII